MRPSNLIPTARLDRTSLVRFLDLSASAAPDISIQDHLDHHFRASDGNPAEGKPSSKLAQLLDQRVRVVHADPTPPDQAFADGIVTSLPSLRSFAVSLTRSVDQAEDLVQETVLRAIHKQEKFEPGTNLQAWLLAILRNLFCSTCRRSKREVEDADGSYAATLISIPDHEDRIMLKALAAALATLPEGQRKAILLVGAEGMSYEAAAQALGCAVGTIQSRVNRARNRLAELMGLERRERHRRGADRAKNVCCSIGSELASAQQSRPCGEGSNTHDNAVRSNLC
jgi:RNA polymerase sigma-70 factor (ECF subfamily)